VDDAPATRAQLRALVAEDRDALERLCAPAAPMAGARVCTRLFRSAAYRQRRGHHRRAWWLWRLNVALTGADIDPRSSIGGGLAIPHPVGISLHVTAGRNLTVRALAGAGAETALATDPWAVVGRPLLGDDVTIGEHASVHGPVRIGDGVRLGPGCKVMRDVPAGACLEVPAPRRIAPGATP
jgi:serine acetyltransferase